MSEQNERTAISIAARGSICVHTVVMLKLNRLCQIVRGAPQQVELEGRLLDYGFVINSFFVFDGLDFGGGTLSFSPVALK